MPRLTFRTKRSFTVVAGAAKIDDPSGGSAATTSDMVDVFFIPKLANTPKGCVAIFEWTDARLVPPRAVSVLFTAQLNNVAAQTRVRIIPNRHTVIFNAKPSPGSAPPVTPGQEFLALANRQAIESPTLDSDWRGGGYRIPAGATVELHTGGSELNGITPSRPTNDPSKPSVAGPIAFVFTTATDGDDKALRVAVHELTHVLGLPHMCGFWDYHTNRNATCCMTYSNQWALAGSARQHTEDSLAGTFVLTPGTVGLTGADHCGRHIKEARRVHLEDHVGLKWK